LLDKLLALSPSHRPSAAELLDHPLFDTPILVPPSYPPSSRTTTNIDDLAYHDIFAECLAQAAEEIQNRMAT
jgi:serine/threonine protein kinase